MNFYKVSILTFLILFLIDAEAQKYKSEEGQLSFFSDAAIEDISAVNQTATSLLNIGTGEIAFLVTITDFKFDKALMQEHFNEKYLESDKYPNAMFKGIISGYDKSSIAIQNVQAKGVLTIHGQANEVEIKGTLQITDKRIEVKSEFPVKLADYKVKIPKLLWQNIAEEVEVKVNFVYSPL